MRLFALRSHPRLSFCKPTDPTQIDLPRGELSGLNEATRILDGVENISVIRFTGADVVRHPLVQKIVEAYERDERGAADAAS